MLFQLACLAPSLFLGYVVYRYLFELPTINTAENKKYLSGKTIWITGASSGIGEALAIYLKAVPTSRVVLSARNTSALENVAQQLRDAGVDQVLVLPLDIGACADSYDLAKAAVDKVLAKFGQIDILIHNAGLGVRGGVSEVEPNVHASLMKVNVLGPMVLTKAVLPHMTSRRSGSLIYMSSVQGKLSLPYRSSYSSSKHAMNGFAHSLRYEVGEFGIKVSVICPGYVKTPLSTNALNADGSRYGAMDDTNANGYDPSYIADITYSASRLGTPEVLVADMLARFGMFLNATAPALLDRIMAKRTSKERLRLEEQKKAAAESK